MPFKSLVDKGRLFSKYENIKGQKNLKKKNIVFREVIFLINRKTSPFQLLCASWFVISVLWKFAPF